MARPLLPPSGAMGWGDRGARGQCVGLWPTVLPGPWGPSLRGEPGEQPELAPLGTKPRASLRSERRPLQRPSSGFTGRREGLQPGGGRSCPSSQAGGGMAPGPSSEQGFPKPVCGAHPEKTLPGSVAVENGASCCRRESRSLKEKRRKPHQLGLRPRLQCFDLKALNQGEACSCRPSLPRGWFSCCLASLPSKGGTSS